MVSRCCGTEVFAIETETNYYVCAECNRPCDLKELTLIDGLLPQIRIDRIFCRPNA
jgi:hypothetical protein